MIVNGCNVTLHRDAEPLKPFHDVGSADIMYKLFYDHFGLTQFRIVEVYRDHVVAENTEAFIEANPDDADIGETIYALDDNNQWYSC